MEKAKEKIKGNRNFKSIYMIFFGKAILIRLKNNKLVILKNYKITIEVLVFFHMIFF